MLQLQRDRGAGGLARGGTAASPGDAVAALALAPADHWPGRVVMSISAHQAFACTDACLRKIGGVYTGDGVHYTYHSCKAETVGTTVYITCYYGSGADADRT